jgi:non-ribosomal peptide synthetase component E (peptide arylation enzyme)
LHAYRIYGLTEHPTVTAGLYSDIASKRVRTDGRGLPGCDVRILNEQGNDVPLGQAGEIATIGPDQFIGYLDPQHEATAFTPDGWFLTGDIGTIDAEGYLTVTDRKKDIIIRGGENISSREVEETLASHAAVADCAAVAMPDASLGERVCAYVVLRPGAHLSFDDVAQHFRARGLARQKTPEALRFIDRLPRNAAGKVEKHVLRARLRGET